MDRTEWLLTTLVFLVACQLNVSVIAIRGPPGAAIAVRPFEAVGLLAFLGVPLYATVHVVSGYVTTASDVRAERDEAE